MPRAEPAGPSRIDVAQPIAVPIPVGTSAGGGRAVLLAGMRVVVGGAPVPAAPELVEAGLVGAVRVAEGWRFLDADGGVWRSDEFTGPLRPAGAIGASRYRPTRSSGVLAVLGGEGLDELALGDGASPLRSILDEQVQQASFLGAAQGLVTLQGGGLALTRDGGSSWRRVPLDAPAVALTPWDDGWRVDLLPPLGARAAERRYAVVSPDADVELRPWVGFELPAWAGGTARFLAAVAPAYPALASARAWAPCVAGRILVGGDGTRAVLRLDARGLTTDEASPLPDPACTLRRWGTRALAECRASPSTRAARLHVSDDGRAFPFLTTIASASLVPSLDGRSIAWTADDDEDDDLASSTLHAWSEGRTFAVALPSSLARVVGVVGRRVLLGESRAGSGLEHWVADLATSSVTPIGRHRGVQIDHEGNLLSCADDAPDGLSCWRAPPTGEPFVEVSLPAGARAVSFADGSRGMAAGDDLGQVHRTTDGGRRWQRLQVVRGDGARVKLATPGSPPQLRCFPERCVLESGGGERRVAVVVWGWGDAPPSETRVVPAASGAPATGEPPAPTTAPTPLPLPLRCTVTAASLPRFTTPPPAPPGASSWPLAAGAGLGRLDLDRARGRARLTWWGRDDAGLHAAATLPTALSALSALDRAPTEAGVTALLLGPRGALVELCAQSCVHWLARPSRPLTRVDGLHAVGREPAAALVTDAGELASASTSGTFVPGLDRLTVRRIGGAGSRVGEASFSLRGAPIWGLTSRGELAYLDRSRGWRALPDAPDAMPVPLGPGSGPLAPCTEPRARGVTIIVMGDRPGFRSEPPSSEPALRGMVEVSSAGACLRAIELWSRGSVAGRLGSRPDGSYLGWMASDGGRSALRCRLE